MIYFEKTDSALLFDRRGERMRIEAWGPNGLRVRATKNPQWIQENWALDEEPARSEASIEITDKGAVITNGKLTAVVNPYGKLQFRNQKGELLLKEYYRSWEYGTEDWEDLDQITMVRATGRSYKECGGNHYHATVRFEANDAEKIYGMGQYQHPYLNQKGCTLEMAQKNTQACVPFVVSSLGYGFLWNNPAIGEVTFGKNMTVWDVPSAPQIEYWVTAGDTPAEIEEAYAEVTGRVPMMPEFGMGFWQCKLRYRNQEEILKIAREYYARKIPVDVIVVDFFHWTNQGDWQFDPEYWPDPEGMIRELESMGMKLMVSIWPTVDRRSVHYREMEEQGLLVTSERGLNVTMECFGFEQFMDPTNPKTRKYVWDICKANYLDKGVALFWLDEAEPEYTAADFENYRYYAGNALSCGNVYPVMYAKTFFEGMKESGIENPVNLIRCAWAGSQKYGALAWSGDVPSTFTQLRNQMQAGLNMGMAGMPWWTADIGGFHGADIRDPKFHELLMRWFQFGAFCPVMRLHGDRDPHEDPVGTSGGGLCGTGAPNEVWSYPPQVEAMMTSYIRMRNRLKPYIAEAMQEAHEKGTPVIKPLFYDFPEDAKAWNVEDAYLFGHDILAAPVMEPGVSKRSVYLPEGAVWTEVRTGKDYNGGQLVEAEAPLEWMPVFVKNHRELPIL